MVLGRVFIFRSRRFNFAAQFAVCAETAGWVDGLRAREDDSGPPQSFQVLETWPGIGPIYGVFPV
jgi:hypothetical protein